MSMKSTITAVSSPKESHMHARNRQQLLLGIRTLYLIVGKLKPLLTSQPRLAEDVGFELKGTKA